MSSLALLSTTSNIRDTYTGYWSPYTLLFIVFMGFIGLILLVVLIIFAMMGHLNPRPAHREMLDSVDEADESIPSMDVALKRSQKTALRKAQQEEDKNPRQKPQRKTGWQFLLGALGCSVVSVMVFYWVDSPTGQMRGLTFGAVVNFLLLAVQIFLTVRFAMCQRRLPR